MNEPTDRKPDPKQALDQYPPFNSPPEGYPAIRRQWWGSRGPGAARPPAAPAPFFRMYPVHSIATRYANGVARIYKPPRADLVAVGFPELPKGTKVPDPAEYRLMFPKVLGGGSWLAESFQCSSRWFPGFLLFGYSFHKATPEWIRLYDEDKGPDQTEPVGKLDLAGYSAEFEWRTGAIVLSK